MKPIKRKINKIIVHCSATQEGRHIDVDEIRRWHVEGRGWSDIGYHYVVYLDGTDIVLGDKTIGKWRGMSKGDFFKLLKKKRIIRF